MKAQARMMKKKKYISLTMMLPKIRELIFKMKSTRKENKKSLSM